MGIKGLLKGLSFSTRKGRITEYQGCRIAIDASSWLHKSVYSVSNAYVESSERNFVDPKCVDVSSRYIISRCKELMEKFRIAEIFLVMDGKRCPLKVNESADREKRRQNNLREARAYKRNGRMDKAEDKYKMCIKINDVFCHSVMREVYKTFNSHKRVKLVWSPYEADAQLAKLCIDQVVDAVVTEDSDVLVYSVASRVAFPVIFKLDRTSGVCDIASMAWLLNPAKTRQMGKAKSALEGLLINFASRESKRPGFGARLFVQGCVLAGCDYAANSLPGVGIVNAFKLVRDNSYRNDSVRFKKILGSLPRKIKSTIEIDDYESTLAKSEAVFYYHVVLHANGHYKHIAEPIRSHDGRTEQCASNHSPLLSRFRDDLSFLGKIDTSGLQPGRPAMLPQQHAPLNNRKSMFPKVSKNPMQNWLRPVEKMKNPYSKPKESRSVVGPLVQSVASRDKKIDANTTNRFFNFAHKASSDISNIVKCNKLPDVRCAKRRFPPFTTESSKANGQKQGNSLVVERNLEPLTTSIFSTSFDYGADDDYSVSACILESPATIGKDQANRLGADDGNHQNYEVDENGGILISKVKKQSSAVEPSNFSHLNTINHEQQKDYISDLGDSDFSPPHTVQRKNRIDEEVVESRFFRKKSARRITLEPADIKNAKRHKTVYPSEPGLQERLRRTTSPAIVPSTRKSSDSSFDDVIDSPPPVECIQQRPKSIPQSSLRLGKKPRGTIEAGFAKQRQQWSFGGVRVAAKKLGTSRLRGAKS